LKRTMTGLDSAFLALETQAAPMHMTGVVVLDPSDGIPASFDQVREHLAPRLRDLPIFRRSLREVPLGLDHPVWVERDVELDAHLRRVAVPEPGSTRELEELVGQLASQPLDRTRPLWEIWVVEGIDSDRTALVTKVHHALLDGVAGAEVFGRLFDTEPDSESGPTGRSHRGTSQPSPTALLFGAAKSLGRRPFALARHTLVSTAALARRAVTAVTGTEQAPALPAAFPAPDTPVNGAITARREVGVGSGSLEELRSLKRALGVTINDVVLELCTGVLRRYLKQQGALPEQPLLAAVPVALGADSSNPRTAGNRVSVMTAELPVNVADPLARLARIHRHMAREKRAQRSTEPELLSGWADLTPPFLLSGLAALYSRLDLADRHRPVVNLIVSNVPGPSQSLFCAGHRVQACYPLGPIYESCALNLTVLSYDGQLHFGWIGCPDVAPDIDRMSAFLSESLTELRRVVECRLSSPNDQRPVRRGPIPVRQQPRTRGVSKRSIDTPSGARSA